jgi:hypothetical protein
MSRRQFVTCFTALYSHEFSNLEFEGDAAQAVLHLSKRALYVPVSQIRSRAIMKQLSSLNVAYQSKITYF